MIYRHYGPASDKIIPIPLRAGVTVSIYGLPLDLTPAEAAKISAVVAAFAEPQDDPKGSAQVSRQSREEP